MQESRKVSAARSGSPQSVRQSSDGDFMAQEFDPAVAYLMALKQPASASTAVAAAPARETESKGIPASRNAEPLAAAAFGGSEKRRSPRYKCEGGVELREEGCDVHTWATFTDISIHGCYVEAQAAYPPGTLLHMKLDACEIRLEIMGKVRVTYPYLGMGIAFHEVSIENSALLRQLVAKVSRPCLIMGPGIASTLPAGSPLCAASSVPNPQAAIQALMEFFENRQMLMREDFLRLVKKSQSSEATR
jgi:hypothetical protein